VNSISLSSFGEQWRGTSESIVIILTLQKNIPDAMAAVDVLTIRKWEHQMIQWMDAYRDGKGTKEAQTQVKKFGSANSRRVCETARVFD
jgi:hypothetical protein